MEAKDSNFNSCYYSNSIPEKHEIVGVVFTEITTKTKKTAKGYTVIKYGAYATLVEYNNIRATVKW